MSLASLVSVGQFYVATLALTLLAWPLASIAMPTARDRGWALARLIAPPLAAWLAWMVAAAGLAPWGLVASMVGLTGLGAAAVGAIRLRIRLKFPALPRLRRAVVATEAVYLSLWVGALLVRAWKPAIFGLEKFMDWAFINAILRTETLPPIDPWFAGEPINYYYFGHMTAAGMIALSGVTSDFGYNLVFAHVIAAFGLGVFAAVRRILLAGRIADGGAATGLGAAAAVMAVFGGNLHSFLYGVVLPTLASFKLIEAKAPPYHFPMSSRFIGFDPATADKTITEFGSYSLYVGDLHAHVMDLPITTAATLMVIALLVDRLPPRLMAPRSPSRLRLATGLAQAVLLGLLIGWAAVTNTWDLPILSLMLGLALVWRGRAGGAAWPRAIGASALTVALAAGAGLAVGWPFWLHFSAISQGMTLPTYGSTFWQWLVLFGNHFAIGCLTAAMVLPMVLVGPNQAARRAAGAVLLLYTFALVLLLVPETVAVKDIYGADNLRSNTMFKTSYQAYAAFNIASVVGVALLVASSARAIGRFAWALVGAVLLVPPLAYAWLVYDQFLRPAPHQWITLNGSLFLAEKPADWKIVEYLRAHPPAAGEAILEASGDSFTRAARISAATGMPTVLGWHVHEWLWRRDPALYRARAEAISRFYKAADEAERRALLDRYRVHYVVVGPLERERYPGLAADAIAALGRVVVDDGSGSVLVDVAPLR